MSDITVRTIANFGGMVEGISIAPFGSTFKAPRNVVQPLIDAKIVVEVKDETPEPEVAAIEPVAVEKRIVKPAEKRTAK